MKHPVKGACTTKLTSSPKVNTDEQTMGVPSVRQRLLKAR